MIKETNLSTKRKEALEAILSILYKDQLPDYINKISLDTKIGDALLNIDSLLFLKLLSSMEQEFDTKINDDFWVYDPELTLMEIYSFFFQLGLCTDKI